MERFLIILTIVVIVIIAAGAMFGANLANNAPELSFSENYEPIEVELSAADLELWVNEVHAAGYNVDVKVNPHAWKRHGAEATDAIRCLTNNGAHTVLSEKNSRNLHLICTDPNTQESWVVVIERIRRYADTLHNATSRLITAFKLTDVTVAQYVSWETQLKCIAVRLVFRAGELFFKPD